MESWDYALPSISIKEMARDSRLNREIPRSEEGLVQSEGGTEIRQRGMGLSY